MSQKITQTAQLQCSKGTTQSELFVTSQNFCKADDKLIATEKDVEPNKNIQPFGNCKLNYNRTCKPQPDQWQKTAVKDTINHYKLLTDKSICPCTIGGIISIIDAGHSEKHEIELELF